MPTSSVSPANSTELPLAFAVAEKKTVAFIAKHPEEAKLKEILPKHVADYKAAYKAPPAASNS